MPRVLLYSPDVIGHPRVYCRVIADALASADCDIVVALGFSEEAGLADSPDLHPLVERPRVTLLDTRDFSSTRAPHLSAEELVALQQAQEIDTTLFIEADKSNPEFERIARGEAGRLHGRNVGIFAKTSEWYPGEDSFTGEKLTLFGPTLRRTLGKWRNRLLGRDQQVKRFYEGVILGRKVLDEVYVKDERVSDWRGPPVYWMPEISRPDVPPAVEVEDPAFLEESRQLREFLQANASNEPVLYFGDAAYYKGYDLFLKFVATTPGTCAIHPGRSYDATNKRYFQHDVDALRAELKAQGRLLETNRYVHSERLKELYFGAINVYLTTHRLALSSSTVIQALELGKPVLVPDRGLLGHRVRAHHLGGVYRYEDIDDLRTQAQALWQTRASFAQDAQAYWQRFSHDSIRAFFRARLLAP